MTSEYTNPVPTPTPDTQNFWDGLKEQTIQLKRCLENECGRFHHFPRSICPYCHSTNLAWTPVSGNGTLYAFSVNHRPPRGWTENEAPVIAIVELEEGIKLYTNLVNPPEDPTTIKIGVPVEPVFDKVTNEVTLLRYRLK